MGPDSARGWNRLSGQPLSRRVTQAEFDIVLPRLMEVLAEAVPEIWANRGMVAMNVQSCCCELDKLLRLTLHQGSVRAKYLPPADGRTLLSAEQRTYNCGELPPLNKLRKPAIY